MFNWFKKKKPPEGFLYESDVRKLLKIARKLKEEITRLKDKNQSLCPECGEQGPVLHCENCGHNWEEE